MGNSTFFGSKNPARPHLVQPGGGVSGEVADLRSDIDEAFVDIEEALGGVVFATENTRYVDGGVAESGTGTESRPYKTITEAIDALETIGGWDWDYAANILIKPGIYEESLTLHQDGINLLANPPIYSVRQFVEIVAPVGEASITLTNATPESLAAYNISGDYDDLVNQGNAGPYGNKILGFRFKNANNSSAHSIRLLGVKGDINADETDFGRVIEFKYCYNLARLSNVAIYQRNSGFLNIEDCYIIGMHYSRNSAEITYINCKRTPVIDAAYDAADPYGINYYVKLYSAYYKSIIMESCLVDNSYVHTVSDWSITCRNCYLGLYDNKSSTFDLNVDGKLTLNGCAGRIDIDLEGACDLVVSSTTLNGDITLASGAGTADWVGGGYTGNLTDPDGKMSLKPTKRFNYPSTVSGTVTARVGERLRYDTSGGTFTINAPATPDIGDSFAVKEIVGDATDVIVSGNGINIENPLTGAVAASATFGQARISTAWEYDGSNWIVV